MVLHVVRGATCASDQSKEPHGAEELRQECTEERLLSAGLPPALHSGPGKMLHVGLSSKMSIEEPATVVPGLKFLRGQPWRQSPVLELNLAEVPIAGMQLHVPQRHYTHTPE